MNDDKKYFNPISSGKFRNHPCHCGSGKKIKKCCGQKTAITMVELKNIEENVKKRNLDFQNALSENIDNTIEELNAKKEERDQTD